MADGTGANIERFNVNISLSKNWDHLQNKFVGTGNPDISKHEWVTNHHRDQHASYVGHKDMLMMFSLAENKSPARVRAELLEKMLSPCGPPPKKAEGDA